MPGLENRILDTLRASPGLKAGQIATRLGVERTAVNSALYGVLRGRVRVTASYQWYLVNGAPDVGPGAAPVAQRTPLGNLSRYYLDCLSLDDLGEVSVFASSSQNALNYCELRALPQLAPADSNPLATEECNRLILGAQANRGGHALSIGYPTRLRFVRGRSGWEGHMVEPILLFPMAAQGVGQAGTAPAVDLPQFNFGALAHLMNGSPATKLEEGINLAAELGLDRTGDEQPDLEDLLARLREIRPEWDWREDPAAAALSTGAPLSAMNAQGIYNRAILVRSERSPYTKGLENELDSLQKKTSAEYGATALGAWVGGADEADAALDDQPLIEVIGLNSEQRQAVRQAMTNRLTVITGPPGTGKSQVVAAILANAAWRQKRVLFASKNNKAVDVVTTRINALGPRPVLLRLGANEHLDKLSEYMSALLAAQATGADKTAFDGSMARYKVLLEKATELDAEAERVFGQRNAVDALEQGVESARESLGEELFASARQANLAAAATAVRAIGQAARAADRDSQSFFTRIFWPWVSAGRQAALAATVSTHEGAIVIVGGSRPKTDSVASEAGAWLRHVEQLGRRLGEMSRVRDYFESLDALRKSRPLEEISRQRTALIADTARVCRELWDCWLRMQPSRLTAEQRRMLGEYNATLRLVVGGRDQNTAAAANARKKLSALFPSISNVLPCWAVTSLSARGRIPFEPNYFDLLVIDEASQCDIASALPLLFRARCAVIIGDPKQLRHISKLQRQQDLQLLAKHELDADRTGWSYSATSLFDLASSLAKSSDLVALRDHHRSHADIIEYSNGAFYENRLRVATDYSRLRRPNPDEPAVRWIDVKGQTVRPGAGSAVNDIEAKRVVSEIERLLSQGYIGSIGVVSPFRAQANRIRDYVSASNIIAPRLATIEFLADTVHAFQGDERDVMFFSPVISAGAPQSTIGFLQGNANLFNVAVTRARAALVVVGDNNAALGGQVQYLREFAAYAAKLQRGPVNAPIIEASDLGAAYPPVADPAKVSDWERVFYGDLYRADMRPIPQYSVEKYVLDFALVKGDHRLDVEVDGELYHRNWDGELCYNDQLRNQRLFELGWDVMRFWVYQIRDDKEWCLARVRAWLDAH